MPFKWSLNPYVGCRHNCTFCFARQFFARADKGDASVDFQNKIVVKTNFARVLRKELGRPSWKADQVALGTATDPYQPAEGRYRITQAVLEALLEFRTPLNMLTKSPLVQRDAELLGRLAKEVDVQVMFSITTVDLDLWRQVEPGTANPFLRLKALQKLREQGVRAGVFMAPILPGLTDSVESIDALAKAARDHDAAFFTAIPLRLMPTVKEHYLGFIESDFPDLLDRYKKAYPGASPPREYQQKLSERVAKVKKERHLTVSAPIQRRGPPGRQMTFLENPPQPFGI
jgi:DNA repair photolyase